MAPLRRNRTIAAGRRSTLAIAVSLVAHAGLLAALAWHAPILRVPIEEGGPPEPVIPVLLMPRALPPVDGQPQGATIRLHRRPQRFAPPPHAPVLPVEPVVVPPTPKADPTPRAPSPAEVQQAQARLVLRRGLLGCANARAAGLSQEERDRCNDRLARGAAGAPPLGLSLNPQAGADFDRAQARGAARAAPPAVGVSRGTGGTASDRAAAMGAGR